MLITRRSLFGLLAAPAIIRVADLMPVRRVIDPAIQPLIWMAPEAKLYIDGVLITDFEMDDLGIVRLPFIPEVGAEISMRTEYQIGPSVVFSPA